MTFINKDTLEVPKPVSKYNLHTPERMEGESFEDYKIRRKKSQNIIKRKFKK